MSVENSIILACVSVLLLGVLLRFGDVISWGFTTMADCIEVDFDPACYSEHSNESAGSNSGPMWWPREE